jgi:hypothetical protein
MLSVLAAVAVAGVLYLVWSDRRWRREQARWLAERDRFDRLAAGNGQDAMWQWPRQPVDHYDHPEPDELVP